MALTLYAHPFSSYCQKALIALYENNTPFAFRLLGPGEDKGAAEHAALWPLKRMPVLVGAGRTLVEVSIIIEHLGLHYPGPVRLIPEDGRAALDVRMLDRIFDNYVMTPMQTIVFDAIRARRKIATAPASRRSMRTLRGRSAAASISFRRTILATTPHGPFGSCWAGAAPARRAPGPSG